MNIVIARKQGRPVDQHERGVMLLRTALLRHEAEIKEEMGIEDEPETTES
jgi:hypothetical protein